MDLVVLGTVALDCVKTPFGEVKDALGGSATYFSVASRLFSECGILGVVGRDFPEEHIKFLKSRGVDTRGLERTDGKTFRWEGEYGFDMNEARTLKTELNVLETFQPKIPDEYKGCKFLFLANTDPDIQLRTLEEIQPQYCLMDTMNFWIANKRPQLEKVMKRVDGLMINEGEARQFCDTPNLVKAGRMLLDFGIGKVIIKKGEHGALFFSKDGTFFAMPAYPLEGVVDTTGAGDSFAGGTVGHLAKHRDFTDEAIRRSMVCGSIAASFTVEGFSLDGLGKADARGVQERYDHFKGIVAFDHSLQRISLPEDMQSYPSTKLIVSNNKNKI